MERGRAIRIGTSGWSYDHWTDVLYPPGLPAAKRLTRYVDEFDTVELNASFYRWPRDAAFTGWRQRLPDGFTMSVKAHRGLTHFRRLKSPEPWVERFERAGVSACLYGHLHIESQWPLAVQGLVREVRYYCVAADAIGFRPFRIELAADGMSPERPPARH